MSHGGCRQGADVDLGPKSKPLIGPPPMTELFLLFEISYSSERELLKYYDMSELLIKRRTNRHVQSCHANSSPDQKASPTLPTPTRQTGSSPQHSKASSGYRIRVDGGSVLGITDA
jgi:hypothetical protein